MCLIIYKPLQSSLSLNEIYDDIRVNSDGFGYAVRRGDRWKYGKFGSDDLKSFLDVIENYLTENEELIIHLRLATAGNTSFYFAHPFNIHNPNLPLGYSDTLLFHNGHIHTFATKTMSDTFILALIIRSLLEIKDFGKVNELLEGLNGKFILTTPEVRMYGHFYEKNGVYYSQPRYNYYYLWRNQ